MASAKISAPLRTYQDAENALHGRASRKLANNTYLERTADGVAIRLHDTQIVTHKKNGSTVLNSGGWHTMTTRARIEAFLPHGFTIWAENRQWYIHANGEKHLFKDGMEISRSGKVKKAGNLKDLQRSQKIRRDIKKYSENFWKALSRGEVPFPSGGDCWYCCMRPVNDAGGKNPMGPDHLLEHMKEGYFVPSLLFRAFDVMGAGMYTKQTVARLMKNEQITEVQREWLERDIPRYLQRYMLRELGLSY